MTLLNTINIYLCVLQGCHPLKYISREFCHPYLTGYCPTYVTFGISYFICFPCSDQAIAESFTYQTVHCLHTVTCCRIIYVSDSAHSMLTAQGHMWLKPLHVVIIHTLIDTQPLWAPYRVNIHTVNTLFIIINLLFNFGRVVSVYDMQFEYRSYMIDEHPCMLNYTHTHDILHA